MSTKQSLSRKKAYLETDPDGFMYRIRKGSLASEWKPPSEMAHLVDGERVYFAFREPMSALFPMWRPETIYFTVPCKTSEKALTDSEIDNLDV